MGLTRSPRAANVQSATNPAARHILPTSRGWRPGGGAGGTDVGSCAVTFLVVDALTAPAPALERPRRQFPALPRHRTAKPEQQDRALEMMFGGSRTRVAVLPMFRRTPGGGSPNRLALEPRMTTSAIHTPSLMVVAIPQTAALTAETKPPAQFNPSTTCSSIGRPPAASTCVRGAKGLWSQV